MKCFDNFFQLLKECFESQDIGKLQEAIRSLPDADARYHMKRCVDSGLWVPSKDDQKTSQEDGFVKRENDVEASVWRCLCSVELFR
jgi:cell division cycle protein 37